MRRRFLVLLLVLVSAIMLVCPAFAANGNFYDTISQASDNNEGINSDESNYDYSVPNDYEALNDETAGDGSNDENTGSGGNGENVDTQEGGEGGEGNENGGTPTVEEQINSVCNEIMRVLAGQFGKSVVDAVKEVKVVPYVQTSGGENPGGENPGGENPGDENPGGENPGGENPGGENPGGENPGGETPTFANDAEEIAYYKNKLENEFNIKALENNATWDVYSIKNTYLALKNMPEYYRAFLFSISRDAQGDKDKNVLAYVKSPKIESDPEVVKAGQINEERYIHFLDTAVSQPTDDEIESHKVKVRLQLLEEFKEEFKKVVGREPDNSETDSFLNDQKTIDSINEITKEYYDDRVYYYIYRTIAHEMGHILRNVYFNYIKEWQAQFWNGDVAKNPDDIPSSYGKTKPDEDFAECVSYVIHGQIYGKGKVNADGSYTFSSVFEGEHTMSSERYSFVSRVLSEVEKSYNDNGGKHPWNPVD